jgi:hypothetical protein
LQEVEDREQYEADQKLLELQREKAGLEIRLNEISDQLEAMG